MLTYVIYLAWAKLFPVSGHMTATRHYSAMIATCSTHKGMRALLGLNILAQTK